MIRRFTERGEAAVGAVVGGALALILVVALILGLFVGFPSYTRWNERTERDQSRTQARLDAQNQVTITNIQIGTTRQKVQIAQQEAQIRLAQAVGIRKAQDEVAKTLTPLYVQFELSQELEKIAASGRNNSVIYLPVGPNGLPIVTGAPVGGGR
jgi:hypothetical protein